MIANLAELPKSLQTGVINRTLKEALEPVAEDARRNAPKDFGDLEESLVIGKKLNKRQRALNKAVKAGATELHFGTSDPAGIMNEFGNEHQSPQPFMRGAWEGNKGKSLSIIKDRLGHHITATAARLQKRRASRGL